MEKRKELKIKKAIEILGRPVMTYIPKIAIEEYDKNIQEATKLLLQSIKDCFKGGMQNESL